MEQKLRELLKKHYGEMLSEIEEITGIIDDDIDLEINVATEIFKSSVNKDMCYQMLKEGGYGYKKVKKGEGGVYVNGKKINSFKELMEMEEIINNISDTVDIVDIIKPIYNFKAN